MRWVPGDVCRATSLRVAALGPDESGQQPTDVVTALTLACEGVAHPPLDLLALQESAPRQLGQRLSLLASGHDVDPRDSDLPCFSVGNGARLDTPEGLDAISVWVTENEVEVVVCDTQRRLTPGLKENESDDMAKLAGNVAELRRRTGVTVILLHHARKGGKDSDPMMMARGSGDILAAVDGALYLERRKDGATAASHAKARWAEPLEPFAFRVTRTDNGGLRLVAVAEAANEKSTKKQQAKITMVLALEEEPEKTLSRVRILTAGTNTGASESTAENALNELVEEGKVSRRKDGRESIYTLTPKGVLPF
jgi:predicted transcriptional regulator